MKIFLLFLVILPLFISSVENDKNCVCSVTCEFEGSYKIYSCLCKRPDDKLIAYSTDAYHIGNYYNPPTALTLEEAKKIFYFYHMYYGITENNYITHE